MIITKDNTNSLGSFKLGYSRGLPSYMAPKLFSHKKTEEYFITALFAQLLFYNKIAVIGVEVCENDSDKGADALIKVLNEDSKKVQVTRFTLTEYLKRRKIAEKQVEDLIEKILSIHKFKTPVNVTINMLKKGRILLNTEKLKLRLAKLIAVAIKDNQKELSSTNNFVNCPVTEEVFKEYTPLITLQGIPKDFHSNFFGRDNIFIDLDFDNISFSKKDVEDECLNIYNKKNGGKASVLLIWADTWEILYDPKYIIERLKLQFKETTFDEVLLFNFYSRLDFYLDNKIQTAQIK